MYHYSLLSANYRTFQAKNNGRNASATIAVTKSSTEADSVHVVNEAMKEIKPVR